MPVPQGHLPHPNLNNNKSPDMPIALLPNRRSGWPKFGTTAAQSSLSTSSGAKRTCGMECSMMLQVGCVRGADTGMVETAEEECGRRWQGNIGKRSLCGTLRRTNRGTRFAMHLTRLSQSEE